MEIQTVTDNRRLTFYQFFSLRMENLKRNGYFYILIQQLLICNVDEWHNKRRKSPPLFFCYPYSLLFNNTGGFFLSYLLLFVLYLQFAT